MTFQRAIYGRPRTSPPRTSRHQPPSPRAPDLGPSAGTPLLGIVLVVSIGLFLLALIVFGRLEGNFAEEL